MFEKTTLPNGLRIVSSRLPHARSVTVCVFVGVGSRYEQGPEAGLSHFIEHLFFKGTERRPTARDIAEAIEGVGGDINAATNREFTEYYCKVADAHFRTAVDVLADALLHSRFDPQEVEKERRVVLEELSMIRDDPGEWVSVLIDETLWPDHPLGRDIAGCRETVQAFTRDAALDFMHRHYAPGNCVVSVVGNVEHQQAIDIVGALLGDWAPQSVPGCLPVSGEQREPRVRLELKRTEQTQIAIAVPGLSLQDDDRDALSVLNVILGGGMSSRLFVDLREELALCYDVSSHLAMLVDTGALFVFAGVDPKRVDDAIRGILRGMASLRSPVPERELRKAKELLKGQFLMSLESTAAVASWIGRQELLLGELETPESVIERIEAVTAEDVCRVAERLFHPEKLNLAVVGPYRSEQRFRSLLTLS